MRGDNNFFIHYFLDVADFFMSIDLFAKEICQRVDIDQCLHSWLNIVKAKMLTKKSAFYL